MTNIELPDKLLYCNLDQIKPKVSEASGYYYYDKEGNQYLDTTSGAYNCVLGHTMPDKVSRALVDQTKKYSYASMHHFENESANHLADKLLQTMPEYSAVCFHQSGADAVEAAIRCILQVAQTRHSPERRKIIGRRGAYHGLTLGALALGASSIIRQSDTPNFIHIDAQDCFNCPFELTYPNCDLKCAKSLAQMIESEGPETVAAFMAVPSTNGGPLPDEYWPEIRAICDHYEVLLVSDEVLEGMWRIGPAIALNRWDVTPDIVCTGKVLGAGFMPIFATLVTESIRDTLSVKGKFFGGHTYMGHFLSCEVGLAVLEEIEERELSTKGVARVAELLEIVLSRVSLQVEGSKVSTLGTIARMCVPFSFPADRPAFYLELQKMLLSAGLVAWIDEPIYDFIELGFAPPYIADEEFFEEFEKRLVKFFDLLFLAST